MKQLDFLVVAVQQNTICWVLGFVFSFDKAGMRKHLTLNEQFC